VHRIFKESGNSCECEDGYAENNNECKNCSDKCLTCFDTSDSSCLSCKSDVNRVKSGN